MKKVLLLFSMFFCLTAAQLSQAGTEALRVEDSPELYRRVLSLPGAALNRYENNIFIPVGDAQIPVLTPYYVYEKTNGANDTQWISIGATPKGGPDGWIEAQFSEDWKHQLVMQYSPRGKRNRVVFFEHRDDLIKLVRDVKVTVVAKELIEQIEKTGQAPKEIVAIEPWESVDNLASPYLMPVFDFKQDTFSRGGQFRETMLIQVAGINTEKQDMPGNEKLTSGDTTPSTPNADELADFKVGIVFVMDTTASMGPYIDRTYKTVEQIYAELEKSNDLERVSFGLVGYRDNISPNPAIEYVTQVFQPLEVNADPAKTLANLRKVKPATVPTRDWYEDAYAGIRVAVQDMNWEPFGARFIVLVSDAGPRTPGDPLASVNDAELVNMQNEMLRKGIAVITLHLVTPEARRANDHGRAKTEYRGMFGATGDPNQEKYLDVKGGTPEEFSKQITSFASSLSSAIHVAAEGKMAKSNELPSPPQRGKGKPDAGEVLLNEIFRAQLEYLGKERGIEAPRFYRAWASERDITDPENQSLNVRVLLTKDQINTLAARLDEILPALRAMDLDPQQGWSKLVELSGRFSVDPNRQEFVEVGQSGVFPNYLSQLPYKSKILSITLDSWLSMAGSARRELTNDMETKVLIYRDLAQDDRIWIDLGANDPNLNVYPLRLSDLP